MAMALRLDGDHPARGGKAGEHRAERLDGHQPAMQEDERGALAIGGVVDLAAGDGDIAGCGCGGHGSGSLLGNGWEDRQNRSKAGENGEGKDSTT